MTPVPSPPPRAGTPSMSDDELAAFQELVRARTGIALGDAKRPLLVMRLADRLTHHGLHSFTDYLRLLEHEGEGGPETAAMVHRVTTHKTDFFREPHHFEYLSRVILPAVIARGSRRPRLWCAAASTGEEPWSLAMVLADFARRHAGCRPSLLASDIDDTVLHTASEGVYGVERLMGVPEELWAPCVLRGKGRHTGKVRMTPELREMVDFRRVNLAASAWPVEPGFDAIFCRNVLIYFDPEARDAIVERLTSMLRPGGWLVLGHAETLQRHAATYERCVPTVYRLVRRRPDHDGGGEDVSPAARRWPGDAGLPRVEIRVGDVHACSTPTRVRTLLGSCVAAALFDEVAGIGGMNHFLVPGDGRDDSGSSGCNAMELLVDQLVDLGARRDRLRAKLFGGARTLRNDIGVGRRNVDFARRWLADASIPVVAERCGGEGALEVYFQTHDGRAWLRHRDGTPAPTAPAHTPS